MKSTRQWPTWPFLLALVALFALSVAAPRSWEKLARDRDVGELLAERKRSRRSSAALALATTARTHDLPAHSTEAAAQAPKQPQVEQPAAPIEDQYDFYEYVELATRPSEPYSQPDMTPVSEEPPFETVEFAWPVPTALLARLERLCGSPRIEQWGDDVRRQLDVLTIQTELASAEVQQTLRELRRLERESNNLATELRGDPLMPELRRASYALARRLDLWENVARQSVENTNEAKLATTDVPPTGIEVCLADVERLTSQSPQGNGWREFLMLDALRQLSYRNYAEADAEKRMTARRVLDRLRQNNISTQQRKIVDNPALAALERQLRTWASESVDGADLLAQVERYEQSGLASDARQLAKHGRLLSWSAHENTHQTAQHFDNNYRNANVRATIHEALLNRMMPELPPADEPVNDYIAGAPVIGTSRTATKLGVRLIPDPHNLRLGMEASGQISSTTTSNSGPATFHNAGNSNFLVRKLVVVIPEGIRDFPPIAEVDTSNRVRSLETTYDGVPLIGSLVRGIAMSQYEEKQPEARSEVRSKIATGAITQVDKDAKEQLAAAEHQFQRQVLEPLRRLALDPKMIAMSTTKERLVVRVRLASPDQLAAHTPRPQAPAGNLASFQVHQSALNNALEQLDLNGRTFTLPELRRWIARNLSRPDTVLPDEGDEEVRITFPPEDSLVVRCDAGRLELLLSVAELRNGRDVWRNLEVLARYKPDANGLEAGLVRDGPIELKGDRLSTRAQIALRGIFSKTFARRRAFGVLPEEWLRDPRMNGIGITQFLIEDGWIAVAVGPTRVAAVPSNTAKQ